MSTMSRRVITSFLDTDAYKLHMQQAVFHQNKSVQTGYKFICRNQDDFLGVYADAIREQVDLMVDVALTEEEYDYLATLPHFKADYLQYLRNYRFKPQQVHISADPVYHPLKKGPTPDEGNSQLIITVEGPWLETILWEIPLLAIVSEVVQRSRYPHIGAKEALETLYQNLERLFAAHSEEELATFKVSDFGTRRRFSREVHEAVVRTLHTHPRFCKHLVGTSNYDLARRMGIPAVGTQAHEWFQAFQQLSPELRLSQTMALKMWLKEYPNVLGIALTDCITMDAFLRDFNYEFASAFGGLRHDSGDPLVWGHKALAHYNALGINPKSKTLVFSDGLDFDTAVRLYNTYKARTNVLCGIGTHLTCSIKGVRPMNIVIKMVNCEGRPVAKVSDSPGKNMHQDEVFVTALMQAFNLHGTPRTNTSCYRQSFTSY